MQGADTTPSMEVIHESSKEPAPMEIDDDSFQRNPEEPFSTRGSSSESPMVVPGGTVIAKRTIRNEELYCSWINATIKLWQC